MLPLPVAVFNRCRSWLNFSEIHASRRVSKSWLDTSGVAKVLSCYDQHRALRMPQPNADFSNVREIEISLHRINTELHEDWIECITQVFQQSKNQLETIHMACGEDFIHILETIPVLPNVWVASFSYVDNLFIQKVLPLLPNLEKFSTFRVDDVMDIDFANLPNLVELRLAGTRIGEIRNRNKCRIEKIDLWIKNSCDDWNVEFEIATNQELTINSFWDDCFLNSLKEAKIPQDFLGFGIGSFDEMFSEDMDIKLTDEQLYSWFHQKPDLCVQSTFYHDPLSFGYRFGQGELIIEDFHYSDAASSVPAFCMFLEKWKKVSPFALKTALQIDDKSKVQLLVLVASSNFFSLEEIKEIVKGF